MKHLSFLILLVAVALVSSAQKYQDALLYGENKNRIDINYLLGLPNDTFAIPSFPQDKRRKPHIAVKGNTIYLWDTTLYKWNSYSAGGSTQGLQDVITEDNELTANNTLNFKNHSLTLDSLLALYGWTKSGSGRNAIFQLTDNGFKAYSTLTGTNKFYTIETLGLEETVRIESIDEDLVRGSNIDVMMDTIWMRASYGNYFWDSLQHSNSVTDKMLVWDSVNRRIAARPIPSTGGSSDSSIIYIDTTFTRLARVINTDTLLFKSLRFRLNGVTVTPDPTDSTESWDFAVIEPSDTASMLATYVRRQELIDTAAAIRGDFPVGGGGSPAGNYGNVQLNRNGALATPASDSLDFDAGLNIIGNLNASKFAWTGNSLYPTLTLSGSDPLIYFGGTGAAYPSFGAGSGSAAIYGSSGTKSISFYDQLISGKQMLRLYTSVGQTAAVFNKTVITVDTMVGGPSTGSIHAEASAGDSTSLSTGINTHMYRGIAKQYANNNAVNTFYGTVIYTNTNSGATGDHIVNWQSDAKKTGASTLDIIYHSAYLGDSIIAGIVNKRYGIKYWDAYLNTGAQLGSQMAFKTDKLKAAAGLNFHFLADSSHYAQLDGNILLGDSVVASSARKTLHIFNGTAPTSNISGAILYAEGGELKGRDAAGNITVITDPAGGSATDLSIGTRTATDLPLNSSTGADVSLPLATSTLAGIMSAADKARLDSNQYFTGGEGINVTDLNDSTVSISLKYDTCTLASFGAGVGLSTDTAAFQTTSIYGSFYNDGSDTLIITKLKIGLQGSSPSITADVFWNDSLNVSAGATKLVTAGTAATNIYEGTTVTSFDNTKIPPGNWIWVKTSSLSTKPTYFSLSLIGYKKRVNP